jgi:hypothetical protein
MAVKAVEDGLVYIVQRLISNGCRLDCIRLALGIHAELACCGRLWLHGSRNRRPLAASGYSCLRSPIKRDKDLYLGQYSISVSVSQRARNKDP